MSPSRRNNTQFPNRSSSSSSSTFLSIVDSTARTKGLQLILVVVVVVVVVAEVVVVVVVVVPPAWLSTRSRADVAIVPVNSRPSHITTGSARFQLHNQEAAQRRELTSRCMRSAKCRERNYKLHELQITNYQL